MRGGAVGRGGGGGAVGMRGGLGGDSCVMAFSSDPVCFLLVECLFFLWSCSWSLECFRFLTDFLRFD